MKLNNINFILQKSFFRLEKIKEYYTITILIKEWKLKC